jgi:hypothetical protein
MDDRKLLELAAKAAGITIDEWDSGNVGLMCGLDGYEQYWSPLAFDDDALRLAIKLDIGIMPFTDFISAGGFEEQRGNDSCAATRRAIVRAAAAIGEQMP